ncbi:MAG: glycerate kinase [Verrucomicrobia bacterium]|nr:glycerate kinase [Verrucomicrobiota bacterium]
MRVLLAFDKFKDSLTAPAACEIAAFALRRAHPDWTLDLCPLADGGEGFCEILTAAAGGELRKIPVTGPRGGRVDAPIGFVRSAKIPAAARAQLGLDHATGEVAVIEMAAASGLALLPLDQRDPWQTTTLGTGELIHAAAEAQAAAILLGVGGSATHDLGLGALSALGLPLVERDGQKISPPIPARWNRGTRFAGSVPATLPPIRIACDVTNPLLGPRGAAAVYGPQKGLRPEDLPRLDHESARLALLLCLHAGQPDALMDTPGAGAAGGISFGLMAAARAKLLPGFDLVSAWLDVEHRAAAADLVITGEGRFDESSLSGKGPGAVAARALALGKQVHVFAGAVTASTRDRLAVHAITPPGQPLAEALRSASANLAKAVSQAFAR